MLKVSSTLSSGMARTAAVRAYATSGSKIVGIDLGTTNSCVAVMEGGSGKVLENSEGQRTTPSVVAFQEDGSRTVGIAAKRGAVANAKNTVFASKRLIGRSYDELKDHIAGLPYKVVKGSGGEALVEVLGKTYSPSEIGAFVLGKMKTTAETYFESKVTKAVITVPAYFNDSQRKATKDAGTIAGLQVERIISEPTAAALSYGMTNKNINQVLAVYDLGGGTFDVSILEMSNNVFEVRTTNGDTFLGGEDFDARIVKYFISEFKKDQGIDLSKDTLALQRLREAAENAKHELSSTTSTEVSLPYITGDPSGPKHFKLTMTRAKLEDLTDDLITKTIRPCEIALKDAGLEPKDIEQVLLVGGMTRMPKVVKTVEKIFKRKPFAGVNPDEAVALGAAVQAGILQGDTTDLVVVDVTPLSLGIETLGGVFTRLIERNTAIPVKRAETFTTAQDNQTSVEIKVLQGEREMAADNQRLGSFHLVDIPPAPRQVPQIEVTFSIDQNGIISVSARDKTSGKEQTITVESKGSLSKDAIEKLVREAKANEAADKLKRELVESRNEAEAIVYNVEKGIREYGDAIAEDDRTTLQDKIKDLRKVMEDGSVESIKKAAQELNAKQGPVLAKAYNSQANKKNAAEGGDKKKSDTVDAEFKDVSDKDKK